MSTKPAFWATFRDNETGLLQTIGTSSDTKAVVLVEAAAEGFANINLHKTERA